MILSILIPTMVSRREIRAGLLRGLERQALPYPDDVEVLVLEDAGQVPTGTKRNQLIHSARGQYVVFIDDDDRVSPRYVEALLPILRKREVDCVGFYGTVYFAGEFGGYMIHSLCCPAWTETPGFYFRPPNHLNPILRDHALATPFLPVVVSEDFRWAQALLGRGVLKKSVFLGSEPLYYYLCRTPKKGL